MFWPLTICFGIIANSSVSACSNLNTFERLYNCEGFTKSVPRPSPGFASIPKK